VRVNLKYWPVLVSAVVVCSLLFSACSCSSSGSTTGSKLPSNKELPPEPILNIPTADKTKLPVIQFTVTPASVAPGATAVLSWNVTNATTVSIDHGIGTVQAAGTLNVSPAAPTIYKLTASNASGSSIKTVSLAVIQAAPPAK
jgi:hypothetical protein